MLNCCLGFLLCIFLARVCLEIRPVGACAMYNRPIDCLSIYFLVAYVFSYGR